MPALPSRSIAEKLEAIRLAAQHEFPTEDIETMLSEIESGYLPDESIPAPTTDPCKD
jgi:hypothetical protein